MQCKPWEVFQDTLEWVTNSANADRKWIVSNDEQNDKDVPQTEDSVRKDVLWGNIMAGGAGVEWFAPRDLNCEDFHIGTCNFVHSWDESRYALEFFSMNLVPFWEMTNDNARISNSNWCLVNSDVTVLVFYLREGGSATFTAGWHDPRNETSIQRSMMTLAVGPAESLGSAPYDSAEDWVVLLKAV